MYVHYRYKTYILNCSLLHTKRLTFYVYFAIIRLTIYGHTKLISAFLFQANVCVFNVQFYVNILKLTISYVSELCRYIYFSV